MTTFTELKQALSDRAAATEHAPIEYSVTKTTEEERYTLGVMYVPGARDADDEFVDASDLQKATWNFYRSGQRMVKDTHTSRDIGELVELISWPYPVETEATLGDGQVHKYSLPAGTVFAGVVWQPEAWALVKSGKLRGYSMGGKAVRMKDASGDGIPLMRDLGKVPEVKKDSSRKIEDDPLYIAEYARETARIHARGN